MTDERLSGRRTALKAAGAATMVGLAGCLDTITPDEGEGTAGDTSDGGDGSNETGTNESEGSEFPAQDVEMICPWAEGGGTDRTARMLADLVADELGSSAYVTNQTGGSGSVGFNAIANADTDGHTLGVLTVEICTIEHLGIADVNHEDVAPVMQYNFDPAALTVHEDAPYGTLGEFVDYAEDNPGEITVSNSGIGAIWHLAGAEFERAAEIEVDHVGYDGAAPATEAVLSGEVQATTSSAAEVAPQVQDGPLEMLAFFGEERHPLFEDVPTLQEEGYDVTTGAWRGIGGPSGLDEGAQAELEEAFQNVYESDEFEEFMDENGFGMVNRNTEEFGQFMAEEYERFGELIDDLNLNE
ncbi:tripartite tricarboxylate transporter substrate binding protein [Halopiger aswanensis]|uniref:Tripartite-type tricarboxylate transporter receptor subunit TctC n=1 Tax=Halopiger aswanensis TaxID=148449 RepID=A0A419WI90_9EURY|nr:tripartite tricarboxylate transporter substrate binding protein [Halopiger aswanensis]RKD95170.1 tripartite-type tricarboxylate transporter receptor subunit TctC [Halopiger aswanensis]